MLSRIRALIVFVQFSFTVAIVVLFMYIFRNNTHKIIKIWMKIQMWSLGIKLEQTGSMDESCDMVIMNHQSLLDIIVVEYIHNRDLAWVGKQEITDLFFFGHIMKAPRMISIERENKAGLLTLLKETKDRLSKGRPIAMFPEGTRTDGKKMIPFKGGTKLIANKLSLKVQPLIIMHTRKILDSQNMKATPGIVKVIYLEPIQADRKTDWFEKTEQNMNNLLQEELAKEAT